jgi:hypothetical protein
MKKLFLFLICTSFEFACFSQELQSKPTQDELRAYNQLNLLKVDLGMNRDSVISKMGGLRQIETFRNNSNYKRWAWTLELVIANPYSRDLSMDKNGIKIEILWYYTDKKSSGVSTIQKEDLSPIVLENNAVIGIGWGFFEDYAKKKELTIKLIH